VRERERIEAMKGKICLGHINNGRKGPGLFFEMGRLQKSEDDLEFSSPFRWVLLREKRADCISEEVPALLSNRMQRASLSTSVSWRNCPFLPEL